MPETDLTPFDRVIKMRIALSVGLAIPLAFFVFLVLWFQEAWPVAAAGVVVYLYILAQFFIFQNPRRNARRGEAQTPDPPEKAP